MCTFERLPVGHWVCRSLGVCEVVEVRGGVRAEVEIEVDAGCRVVRGVVLDGGRRPVEGARIWTSQADRGRFAADSQRTGPGGRFELVVAPWTTVGASADGYAPVAAAIVASEQGPPVELTLMLEERGAGLRGVVVDADGRPVPGAEVGVGHLLDGAGPPVTTPEVAPRPERVRADAEGRFTLPSLVAGEALVHARGAGFGAVVQVVGLEAGAELEVRLELPREAVVTGVVRDVRGAPVADATVHVARGDQANARRTSTDARGRYRLDGVTPGRALVEVTDYRGGFATKVLDLEVGGAATWDVQLADGELQLTGNVVTADDRPLAYGWVVHVTPSGQRVHQLDRGGAFVVPASERDAAVASPLLVFDQDPRDHLGHVWGVPRAIVNDLRVEDGHATIRLADEPRASWLRGRVVDREGRAPNEVVVLRASDGARSWRLRLDPLAADGAFDVGPLPKGRYHVNLASNSLRSFGPFEVAEGQSLDLGTLQVAAATPRHAVRLGLVFPAGEAGFEPVDVEVRSLDDGFVLRHYHAAGGRESDPMVWLPVGRHRVVARTASGLVAERALDVVGDARTGRLPLLRFERR